MTADPDAERVSLWLFVTALCVGGAERTLVDLANELDADAYDVTVWTIFDANPLAGELDADVDVRSLTHRGRIENGSVVGVTNPVAYLTVPVRFCLAARRERPDVVQSFLFFDNVLARVAGCLCDATVITGVRAVPDDPSTVRATVDRLTIGLSDVVVSNSEAGRELAVERGADPERVRVIRNGRHVEQYGDASAAPVEAELDVGESELVVGIVGRLLERKGHFELLDAWEEIQRREPDARLLLVGDGRDRASLESRARDLGVADSVEFLGTRSDVPRLLAAMDVFVFPSHYEGLPGAVIEAMAAGLPIVATPVDGTAELLDGYRTGLFVPVEDPDALSWAVLRLLETPSLRDALGDAARQRALESFAVRTMVAEFEALYASLEAEPGGETVGARVGTPTA